VDLLAIKFTGFRTLTALQKGQIPGPEFGLAKVTTVNAAIAAGELIADVLGRDALEGVELPDLWPTAVEAGWPGLLVDDDHGGAGLGGFDAMLVAQECGRV